MKYQICDSIWGKTRGLMFSRKKNLVFVFDEEKITGLHMCFVFFPIDVLFLDENKRIIEIKRNFRPFRFYTSKNKARYVVELTDKHNFRLGDKVDFE